MKQALIGVLAMGLLAGCGGGTGKPPPTTATARTSTTEINSTSPRTQANSASASIKILAKASLAAALLPLADMPTGYSQDTTPATSTTKTFCNYAQPTTVKVYVSHTYLKGVGISTEVIGLGIRQYESPAAARISFTALTTAMKTCHTDTDTDGSPLTYSLMNVALVGQGSVGIRIEGSGQTALQSFALCGAALINVGAGGAISADGDVVGPLLEKQVVSYQAAATR